ncbi:MAG: hydrogenase nickel incorporation protein HypB [Pirellulales bacterium]
MRRVITIQRDVSAPARAQAEEFRGAMTRRGTLVVNVLSSPGSGKTSLLAATAIHWGPRRRMAVLVGDIATDRDAQRLAPLVPTVQLTTGGACHLELSLVERGLAALPAGEWDFLFIENVGNLVCPSSHDLGEHLRVVVLSTTEGDDKPAKYPKAFRTSQALLISKIDLLPHVPFSIRAATDDARSIQPDLWVWPVSALQAAGIDEWCNYLDAERHRLLSTHVQTANSQS